MKLKRSEYLKLCGLLSLCPAHNKALREIEAAVCNITGENPFTGTHSGDAVYSDYTADELLEKLTPPKKAKKK